MWSGNTTRSVMKRHGTHSESKSVTPLTVDLKVPAKAKAGDSVKITATVKHGKTFVNEADEVMFEIIKDKDMKNSVKEKVKKLKMAYIL